jgi:hypothetical protein
MEQTIDKSTEAPSAARTGGFPSTDWRAALRTPLVLGLGALLLVQLVLALLLGRGGGLAPASDTAPLLELDIAAVDEVLIESGDDADSDAGDGKGDRVRIARTEDGWVLPDLDGFPAAASRVEQVLDDLDGISRPLPVATSADARRRFRVADDAFERRLTLRGGGEEATLIIGDSPGFRRLFARVDGEEAVYDLRLGLFDLAAEADGWIDRGRLQFDRGEITRIGVSGADIDDWALVRAENGWSLEGSDAPIDQTSAESLVNAVATVGYSGLLGEGEDAVFDLMARIKLDFENAEGHTLAGLLETPPGGRRDLALRAVRPLLHLRQGHRRRLAHQPRAGGARHRRAALRLHRARQQRRRLRQHQLHLQRAGSDRRGAQVGAGLSGPGAAHRPQPGRRRGAGRGAATAERWRRW